MYISLSQRCLKVCDRPFLNENMTQKTYLCRSIKLPLNPIISYFIIKKTNLILSLKKETYNLCWKQRTGERDVDQSGNSVVTRAQLLLVNAR